MDAAVQAFTQARLYAGDGRYMVVHLPPRAITAGASVLAEIGQPFSALIVDKDELTLVVPQEYWDEFAGRLPDHRASGDYRLITFDLPLDLGMIGFMALISRVLAEAGIPILALSAYERDHILVPGDRFQTAWDVLQAAQQRLAAP